MTADPLAEVQPGDPDPKECLGPYERASCQGQHWDAEGFRWSCTRLPEHVGQHIAGTGTPFGVCAVWPQGGGDQ